MATHAFRFALGSPERPLSLVWRAWTHDDEAHLSVRTARGELMLTAYPTGRWRIATGKDVSRWTRPGEFRPGWIKGPDIILPHTDTAVIQETPDPNPAEPVHWLTPPGPGQEAHVTLLFASPRAEESHWRPQDVEGTESVTTLRLRTTGCLHLSRVDAPVPGIEPESRSNDSPVVHDVTVGADSGGRPSFRESRVD